MRRDYALTFVTTAAVIVGYLLSFRLVAQHLGANAFGSYALARRTISLLAPATILGADYATARLVAYAIGKGRPHKPYLPAALVVMLASSTIASIALVVFRGFFAGLFYGSEDYVSLVLILSPLLIGLGLYSVAYNYLRGCSRFVAANCFYVVINAVVPIASVFVGGSVERILLVMSLCWIGLSVAVIARLPIARSNLRGHAREVLRFGVPRAPGDLLQLALLAAPAVITAHLADLRIAGLVAFGTSSLTLVGSAVSPIAFILLPLSANMLGRGNIAELRRHVSQVLKLVITIAVVSAGLVELFATQLVRAYLGPDFLGGVYVVRIMLLGAIPYAIYFTLKSIIDARHIRAINTRNMLLAAVTFAVTTSCVALVGITVPGVLAALVASLYVLGALTAWEAHKILGVVPAVVEDRGRDGFGSRPTDDRRELVPRPDAPTEGHDAGP